ncbi:MAG: hypothetical protein JWN44_631 [Myxococcales bacterium]|nr:hypothetical protein [Myxococcales bacterium]
MKTSTIGWCAAALFAGCATTPPTELRDARAEYERARTGAAAQLAPADLHRAEQALAQAEQAFAEDPRAPVTVDLAYAAQREAEVAESAARSAQVAQKRAADEAAIAAAQRDLQTQRQAAQTQAESATQARADAERRAQEAAAQRQVAEAQVQQERASREQTEAALHRVEQFATVSNEARGRVITLNGSILFASGTADLLPAARTRLDEVAQALKTEHGSRFTVEGFTDSRGPATRNQQLSEARANSVRDYLISQGVDEDHMRAVGRGEDEPVASNATPDGRANNRRVEIIISHHQAER